MKILKRPLKIAAYAGGFLVIALIILAGISQTSFFRDRLRAILSSALSNNINGSLYLGKITGNLITGFTIDSIALYNENDLFLSTATVTFRYDPLTIPQKTFTIQSIALERPTIHFLRWQNGEWNISKLFKPSEDTTRSEFDWTIRLHGIELNHGTVTLIDFTEKPPLDEIESSGTSLNYHNFTINDLNVKLNATFEPKNIAVNINHASFYMAQPRFELTHLEAEISANEQRLIANNVVIQTTKSYVEFDAAMDGLNIFNGISLAEMQSDSTKFRCTAKKIDFAELKTFIPALDFLEGSAFVDLEAVGEFGNLNILRLKAQTYESTLHLSGYIRNLHQPSDLRLNIVVGDARIHPADISLLLPRFGIPKFIGVEQATFSAEYSGHPLDFKARTLLQGDFGEITVNGSMNLHPELPTYDLTFTTNSLQLGPWFEKDNFKTRLFTHGVLKGEGFSIDSMFATLTMTIDTSSVQKIVLNSSSLSVRATPQRLELTTVLQSRDMKADIIAHYDVSTPEVPRFDGDISLTSVDLSKVLGDTSYRSNLTLRAILDGSGSTIDDISIDSKISLFPSTFRHHVLAEQDIKFLLEQHDLNNKQLSLHSSIANVDIIGKFDIDLVADALARQATNLIATIKKHASPPETAGVVDNVIPLATRWHTSAQRQMDFTFNLNLKNLEPIASLIGTEQFNASGIVKGRISGTDENLSLTCEAALDELYIGTSAKGVFLEKTFLDVEADSLSYDHTLEQLAAIMKLSIGSGLINVTKFDSTEVNVTYANLQGKVALRGTFDSLYTITMAGNISIQPNTYAFDFEEFTFSSDKYTWHNDQDIQLRLNYEGIRAMHATMKRYNESVSLIGVLHHTGEVDFHGVIKQYDLEGVNLWIGSSDLARPGRGFDGKFNAELELSGSLTSPRFRFTMVSESTYFRQTRIGNVNAIIIYQDETASIDMNVIADPNNQKPDLIVKGTLPMNLAFSGVTEQFLDQSQSLRIVSEGFDIGVLDPIFVDLNNLRGSMLCDVSITGTPRNPEYHGTLTLSDVHFIFLPNNIVYIVSGTLTPAKNKLLLTNVFVHNNPEDGLVGKSRFTGSVTIKDFRIESFDITAVGELLVMSDATRKVKPTFYGTLLTETDPEGINFRGTLSEPYLSGKLYVKKANLIFPPTKVSETQSANFALNYAVVEDTSQKVEGDTTSFQRVYAGPKLNNESFAPPLVEGESFFLDRLRYNLTIETRGTTAIRMIFTPSTNEELYAELDGKVNAVNQEGTPLIYGQISVLPRSYYNFIKRFDASGVLRYVGPWDNPELDIDAAYEGYHQLYKQPATVTTSSGQEQKSSYEKVIVVLDITGTRYEPRLTMSMKVQPDPNSDPVDWSGDVQSDAISFILTNKFRDELTAEERGDIASNFGAAGVSGITSTLLSGIFSDFLRKEFPFIRSAEITYQGGSFQESADLRLSGEAFKGYWRFGGRIFNSIGNANVSYLLNLGDVLNATSIRNLFLEFERKVEGSEFLEDKTINGARLYYRFSF
ncbi:MAG: translocation/assembly module TamB domain-containing protein [Ignavibacteriae bacterium]|nr:translocation/assembly module TamB domain-containing protein [Ignavibacteriota bacterium]